MRTPGREYHAGMPPAAEADRHAAEIDTIRHDVLSAEGVTEPALRAAVADGGGPEDLASYLAKVRHASYRVTEQDIEAVKRSGLSEDAIFELTVAAIMGFAYERLQFANRAMRTGP